ncbi:MAG: phytoene desaturase family protein [Bacteroidia bacterium]
MGKKKVVVIGAGFAGLSAATSLADKGYEVVLLEKNSSPGGRARMYEAEGFRFDMGPSWYWMPDVFEAYFNKFGKKVSDYYELIRLDPGYTIVFGENDRMTVPADMPGLEAMFESYEPGAGLKLREFLAQAAYKYEVGINKLVYKPSRSITEFLSPKLLYDMLRMDIFSSMSKHVRKYFSHPQLIKLMEFPVLFLGATPQNTPALYSLMNYADLSLGTWYPQGGMFEIVKAFVSLAEEKGVKLMYNAEVSAIEASGRKAKLVKSTAGDFEADVVVAGADYAHIDQKVMAPEYRNYTPEYWDKRTMAPSSLLFYIGLNKRLEGLTHHTLFFDEQFDQHAHDIYTDPKWPSKPLFYTSLSSKTDPSVAPQGCENLVILVPLAPDLEDSTEIREHYYDLIMDRFERLIGQSIRDAVIYKRSYAHNDFKADYHAYKGNAYGLANTLLQTAILKPALKNKKLDNVYFTGQLTVPGPGVPPTIISGQVVADEIFKEWPNN